MDGQLDREKPLLYFATEVSCYLTLQQAMYILVTYLHGMALVRATKQQTHVTLLLYKLPFSITFTAKSF